MRTRREILRVGGLGTLGITLPQLLSAQKSPVQNKITAKADACIVICLNGGPSHLDMWDLKPSAPAELRGEFVPISTSTPGVIVCEHLPRLATLMDRVTLVRSMNHSVNNSHAAAVYAAMTGHDRGEQGGGAKPTDHPSPGAVLALLHRRRGNSLPYVALPYQTKEGAGGPLQPGFQAGFIGASYNPFWVLDNPNAPRFRVRNLSLVNGVSKDRLAQRKSLLSSLNGSGKNQTEAAFRAMDDFQQQAFDLLSTGAAQRAFQLDAESADVRDNYGRNIYGQSVLLARRLIEAGTRMVTMSWAPDANATWDTHAGNFKKLKNTLLPQFDAACSSLVQDLEDRGLLERTLVLVLGEFGRSPKINNSAGRDHWNACYSMMLVGGGIKKGLIFGASDRSGAQPIQSPVTPGDIMATVYRLLGIDANHQIYDLLNRPHPVIPKGRILHELIA